MEMRWIQSLELVLIYLIILLLVIVGSSAPVKPVDTADNLLTGNSSNLGSANSGDDVTADVLVQNWRGLAIKDDETHPVRLNVETIMTVDPSEVRRLLASNISLKEIRSQARVGNRNMIQRGNIRLNNDGYRLTDIVLKSSGNRSILEASVASSMSTSGSGDIISSAVGHIVLIISEVDDVEVAEGYLTIGDSKYSGNYSLSLNEWPGRGPRAGPRGAMGN